MSITSDTLTVDTLKITFDRLRHNGLDDETGMCVGRIVNGKVTVLKMEFGEQAEILYRLLTEQTTKAEIKAESKEAEYDKEQLMKEITELNIKLENAIDVIKGLKSDLADARAELKEGSWND